MGDDDRYGFDIDPNLDWLAPAWARMGTDTDRVGPIWIRNGSYMGLYCPVLVRSRTDKTRTGPILHPTWLGWPDMESGEGRYGSGRPAMDSASARYGLAWSSWTPMRAIMGRYCLNERFE